MLCLPLFACDEGEEKWEPEGTNLVPLVTGFGVAWDFLPHRFSRLELSYATRDEEFDTVLDELEAAGYVEQYAGANGQPAMRLTAAGEQVAHQLAMVADDDAAAMMAGLLGDELEGGHDDEA